MEVNGRVQKETQLLKKAQDILKPTTEVGQVFPMLQMGVEELVHVLETVIGTNNILPQQDQQAARRVKEPLVAKVMAMLMLEFAIG